jgi:hypothetical protein
VPRRLSHFGKPVVELASLAVVGIMKQEGGLATEGHHYRSPPRAQPEVALPCAVTIRSSHSPTVIHRYPQPYSLRAEGSHGRWQNNSQPIMSVFLRGTSTWLLLSETR